MSDFHSNSEFDSLRVPLDGVTLVEAAAGTGKTYNIQNLAARLIVEKSVRIDSLVIVTFTEKAAGELTDRLHLVLSQLLDYLLDRLVAEETACARAAELAAWFDQQQISRHDQIFRLQAALLDFDDNRVSTIHGFCARVLSENAFESNVAFRVRLEKNLSQYTDKLLGDFCRLERYRSRPLPGAENLTVTALQDTVQTLLNRRNLKLEFTRPRFNDRTALLQELDKIIDRIMSLPDPLEVMENFPGGLKKINDLSGSEYWLLATDLLSERLEAAAAETEVDYQAWLTVLTMLDSAKLLQQLYVKQRDLSASYLQQNELFMLARDYCQIMQVDCPLFLQLTAADFVRKHLELWKSQDNFQSFDDLLIRVHNALEHGRLAPLLQRQFQAGIIDEFQDTDDLQYQIFRKIFIRRPDRCFFMVGDPRQAIYSFRGGDLATYMAAKAECLQNGGSIYTLSRNFRSSRYMIENLNKLFEHESPFASGEITFSKILLPDQPAASIYLDGRELTNPLSVDRQENMNSETLYQRCADEIAGILNSKRYSLPDKNGQLRSLAPGDIAVLAYDNYVLETIRHHLERFNIPAISERKSGIWSSREAEELLQLMHSVLDNNNDSLIRETLAGPICQVSLREMDLNLPDAGERLLSWRLTFRMLNQTWHQDGTASFIRQLFRTFGLKKQLAGQLGGSRSLANYTQLGDLLSSAEQTNCLSPRGVLKYLQEQICHAGSGDESAEMLESDRTAVKLMTIHASKGLQFPVVFLPQLAARYPLKRNSIKLYHRNGTVCCNPDGQDPEALFDAATEELQELMRLVYVAVTRACCMCRFSWGKLQSSCTPLDWLFRMRKYPVQAISDELLKSFLGLSGTDKKNLNAPEIPSELLQTQLPGSEKTGIYFNEPEQFTLQMPPTVPHIRSQWHLMSYSALELHGQSGIGNYDGDNGFDYDSADENISAATENSAHLLSGGVWDIPGGAAIGNAWHKILETTDFTSDINPRQIADIMQLYSFSNPEWIAASCRMFEALMQYELPCGLQLKYLPRERRRNEMEFVLNTPCGIDQQQLCNAVSGYLQQEFGDNLNCSGNIITSGGFFTGFIDMVFEYQNKFYIVDWKSNTLGRNPAAFYDPELKKQLFDASYPMQYICYTAALVRFLEQRLGRVFDEELFDRYIGDVYYIFLRGMTLEKPGGVFSARVPFATIKNICDIFEHGSGTR